MMDRNHRFWALVAFNLTVAARETYVPQTEDIAEPAKLRAYNEMLHRICSYIASVEVEGGSDSWLHSVLLEMSERSETVKSVTSAIENAKKALDLRSR